MSAPAAGDAETKNVRAAGLKKMAYGGAVALLFVSAAIVVYSNGYRMVGLGWLMVGVPLAWGLVGALEVLTGVPYTGLAQKWDELSAGRRGALTFAAVVAAFALMIGGSVLVVLMIQGW